MPVNQVGEKGSVTLGGEETSIFILPLEKKKDFSYITKSRKVRRPVNTKWKRHLQPLKNSHLISRKGKGTPRKRKGEPSFFGGGRGGGVSVADQERETSNPGALWGEPLIGEQEPPEARGKRGKEHLLL